MSNIKYDVGILYFYTRPIHCDICTFNRINRTTYAEINVNEFLLQYILICAYIIAHKHRGERGISNSDLCAKIAYYYLVQ